VLPGQQIQAAYPHLSHLAPAFPLAAKARRGLVGWVERAGLICEGEAISVQIPEQAIYSA
jgi:hypothetical protein